MTADAINYPTIRVSLIIINDNEEILLVKHRKKDREYWVLPGGHLEYGETFAECAIRELKEETNLDGQFQRIVFISESLAPNKERHIINVFTLVEVLGGQLQVGSDEDILCEAAYKPLTELSSLTVYPDINQQIISKFKEGWTNPNIELLDTPWS
jgi:8-oxo-dGTP diphosphatase